MALFERRGRYYLINNKKLIRVTAVLDILGKPALIPWAARSAAEIALSEPSLSVERVVSAVFQKKETAADIGTDVHRLIELINRGEQIDINSIPPDKQGFVQAFLSFSKTMNPVTIKSELECYSIRHGYAGTTDWITQFPNKEIWLLDFKTGGIYIEAGLQLSAYKTAVNEMIDNGVLKIPKVEKTAVIQLCHDGTFNLRIFDHPAEIFLKILDVFNWYDSNK